MCLLIKNKNALIAEEDIVCYKKLQEFERTHGENDYVTPYMYSTVTSDEIKGKKPFKAKCYGYGGAHRRRATGNFYPEYSYAIASGYVHTYKNLDDAMDCIYAFDRVFKCIIPKGTKYYEGLFDNGEPSYASKEIIIKEEQTFK